MKRVRACGIIALVVIFFSLSVAHADEQVGFVKRAWRNLFQRDKKEEAVHEAPAAAPRPSPPREEPKPAPAIESPPVQPAKPPTPEPPVAEPPAPEPAAEEPGKPPAEPSTGPSEGVPSEPMSLDLPPSRYDIPEDHPILQATTKEIAHEIVLKLEFMPQVVDALPDLQAVFDEEGKAEKVEYNVDGEFTDIMELDKETLLKLYREVINVQIELGRPDSEIPEGSPLWEATVEELLEQIIGTLEHMPELIGFIPELQVLMTGDEGEEQKIEKISFNIDGVFTDVKAMDREMLLKLYNRVNNERIRLQHERLTKQLQAATQSRAIPRPPQLPPQTVAPAVPSAVPAGRSGGPPPGGYVPIPTPPNAQNIPQAPPPLPPRR